MLKNVQCLERAWGQVKNMTSETCREKVQVDTDIYPYWDERIPHIQRGD